MTNRSLVLASQSSRRHQLLSQLGYEFTVQPSDIDESAHLAEKPEDYVVRLAQEKAQTVFNQLESSKQSNTLVLGSDTCVVINNQILGKPVDLNDCIETLSLLSDAQHQVMTAIAVISTRQIVTKLVITKVNFKALSLDEIQAYWHTGEPQDKAGSYAIQGIAGQFVKSIEGSYSAVVGLPLYETALVLKQLEMPLATQVL